MRYIQVYKYVSQTICFVAGADLSWRDLFLPRHCNAGARNFPFYSRRGAGRRGSNIKHQNSLWKTTIINDIWINDHYIHNLLENSELTGFARIGFGIAIELDGDSHNERLTITFNGTINIKKELGCLYYYPGLRPPLLKKKGSFRYRPCRA